MQCVPRFPSPAAKQPRPAARHTFPISSGQRMGGRPAHRNRHGAVPSGSPLRALTGDEAGCSTDAGQSSPGQVCWRIRPAASAARCCAGRTAWWCWRTGTANGAVSRWAADSDHEGRPVIITAPARETRAARRTASGSVRGPAAPGQDGTGQPDLRRGPARRGTGREGLGRRPAAGRCGRGVPRRDRRPAADRGGLRTRSAVAGWACWSITWCRGARSPGSPSRSAGSGR